MVTPRLIDPSNVPHKTLHTGQKMPMVGVGFWKSAQLRRCASRTHTAASHSLMTLEKLR